MLFRSFAGIKLSGARVRLAKHNALDEFARHLADARAARPTGRVLVVTESVFSMDGDRAPLAALRALCDAHDAWLLVGALRRGSQPGGAPIPGLSGTLSVDGNGRVRRQLEWSVIGADGQPHPLGTASADP